MRTNVERVRVQEVSCGCTDNSPGLGCAAEGLWHVMADVTIPVEWHKALYAAQNECDALRVKLAAAEANFEAEAEHRRYAVESTRRAKAERDALAERLREARATSALHVEAATRSMRDRDEWKARAERLWKLLDAHSACVMWSHESREQVRHALAAASDMPTSKPVSESANQVGMKVLP